MNTMRMYMKSTRKIDLSVWILQSDIFEKENDIAVLFLLVEQQY